MKVSVIITWLIVILTIIQLVVYIMNTDRWFGHRTITKTATFPVLTGIITLLWLGTMLVWDLLAVSVVFFCTYIIVFISALIDYWEYKIISYDKPKDVRTSVKEFVEKSDQNKKTS